MSENETVGAGRFMSLLRRYAPIVTVIGGFLFLTRSGLVDNLSLDTLGEHRELLTAQVEANLVLVLAGYVALYIFSTALFLPGASILTIAGGFLFGLWIGGAAAVIGASVGATFVFLASKTAFGDSFRGRLSGALLKMEKGFRENELSYLFVLRLVPLFPFYAVNIVAGLLGVRLANYAVATLFGIIPGSFVYASVGVGLDALFDAGETPNLTGLFLKPEILTPIIGLTLLSLAPVFYKALGGKTEEEA